MSKKQRFRTQHHGIIEIDLDDEKEVQIWLNRIKTSKNSVIYCLCNGDDGIEPRLYVNSRNGRLFLQTIEIIEAQEK